MSGGFLRNAAKCKQLINNNNNNNVVWHRRQSISDTITTPINRTFHIQTQFKPYYYTRLPHSSSSSSSSYKKAKDLDFSRSSFLLSSAAAFSSKPAPASSKVGIVGWYLGMVKARPILTKSITSSLIYVAADLSAQTMMQASAEPYDILRTIRMAGYGLIIMGPALHFWFNFVSKVLPKGDLITTFKKMCFGQLVFGPIMTAVFFSTNAGLQGESAKEIIARLKRDLIPTLIRGVMYWPICDFVTFRFIPVHLQPLVSNSFSYLWTIYMTYMASLEKALPKTLPVST